MIESFVRSSRADDVVDAGPSITSPDCIGSGWTKGSPVGAERDRVAEFGKLEDGLRQAGDWYLWGPYVSERQWGTVREDYSADGEAWTYFPHDHARSRAYRWGEDGLAGFCDIEQRLCLGLALWNGRDPILKERAFGLTGAEANHGEDVKEYWWYLDAVPSHAWNRWRYHYPQGAFPYEDLRRGERPPGKLDPEYELLDTGAFDDDRYWIVEVPYAKADPGDVLMSVQVTNAGPERGHPARPARPRGSATRGPGRSTPHGPGWTPTGAGTVAVHHPFLGELELLAGAGPGRRPAGRSVLRERDEHRAPVRQSVGHAVPQGRHQRPRPDRRGHREPRTARDEVRVLVPAERRSPGATVELRLRLRPAGLTAACRRRTRSGLRPCRGRSAGRRPTSSTPSSPRRPPRPTRRWSCARPSPACCGASSSTTTTWPAGWTATRPSPTAGLAPQPVATPDGAASTPSTSCRCRTSGSTPGSPPGTSRSTAWRWPTSTRRSRSTSCVLLCREWFQHPNGALPAYEWDFGDVNPPVQAWAALEVFVIDGGRDLDFLSQVFDKLLVNFTWWVNREDAAGSNLFEGGFLGLDNIGPLDRSHLPVGGTLEQSDATGWMASYALAMAAIALFLQPQRPPRRRPRRSSSSSTSRRSAGAIDDQGLWDDADGLFYDRLVTPDGTSVPVKVRSMVGIIPMLAAGVIDEAMLDRAERFGQELRRLPGPGRPR